MTSPRPPDRPWLVTGQASMLLRLVAVAAVVAILIAGFLCLDHLTPDRVGTGLIATGVLGAILIIV